MTTNHCTVVQTPEYKSN